MLTIVIATHRKADRLKLVLAGLARQRFRDFEIVVAVDDEDSTTLDTIKQYVRQLPLQVVHTWKGQPAGRAVARNQAIARASGSRILIIDDDCVVLPGVLEWHHALDGNTGGIGLRKRLAESDVAKLTEHDIINLQQWPLLPEIRESQGGRLQLMRKLLRDAQSHGGIANHVFTCHVSFPTHLLWSLGGFWDGFEGWGAEDVELAWRAWKAGCNFRLLENLYVVHLDHPVAAKNPETTRLNRERLKLSATDPELVLRGKPMNGVAAATVQRVHTGERTWPFEAVRHRRMIRQHPKNTIDGGE